MRGLVATGLLATGLLACGPERASTSVGGGDSESIDTLGTATSMATETVGTDGSEDTETSSELTCDASEFPPPFCHVGKTVEPWAAHFGPVLSNGTRPLLWVESQDPLTIHAYHVDDDVLEVLELPGVDLRLNSDTPFTFGDIDGDGIEEVIVQPLSPEYTGDDKIPVLALEPLRLLTGIPNDPITHPYNPDSHQPVGRYLIRVLDVDLDGRDEVLAYVWWTGTFEVWSYDGAWTAGGLLELDPCLASLERHADLDTDGHRELLLHSRDWCPFDRYTDISSLTVLRGRLGATIPDVIHYSTEVVASSLHVGDFDADGHTDVLVLGPGPGESTVSFLRGEPGGTFATAQHSPFELEPSLGLESFWLDTHRGRNVTGDFSGGGQSSLITIAIAQGPEPFTVERRSLLGTIQDGQLRFDPLDIDFRTFGDVGDFNGDGIDDLGTRLVGDEDNMLMLSLGVSSG